MAKDKSIPMNLRTKHPAYHRIDAANHAMWHAHVILNRALDDAREYAESRGAEDMFPLLAMLSRARALVSAGGQLLSADDEEEHIENLTEEVWNG